jgi:hypothetical protein
LKRAILVAGVSLAGIALAGHVGAEAARTAALPPDAAFKAGYNKCKLATPAALSQTAGKQFATARFDGKTCTWSSSDGNYVVLVDTHPAGYIELLGPSLGKHPNGDTARLVSLPGATKAVLETFSHKNTGRYAKDLLAAYPQGVVQVSLNFSTALSDKTTIAVARLLTHT